MLAALILVFSVMMLVQFSIYTWRMAVISLAANPLSDLGLTAIRPTSIESTDFRALSALNGLCPELEKPTSGLRLVRAYCSGITLLDRLSNALLPAAASWTQNELALCTRYMSVEIDQRLQRNQLCYAALRSY